MIHWLRVAVWGASEQRSWPQALISFPGANEMTSGFGPLPGVMCVLLDLFTSWLGPKCLHGEGNHMFICFVFQDLVLLLAPVCQNVSLLLFPTRILKNLPPRMLLLRFGCSPSLSQLGFRIVSGVPGSPAELGLSPLSAPPALVG